MTQIDQFESIFRAASFRQYEFEDWQVKRVLTVCDGDSKTVSAFEEQVRGFLGQAFPGAGIEWKSVPGDEFGTVDQLVELTRSFEPDLICSHRNLHISANEFPYSLGVYIDVLTQVAAAPLMLLPHPSSGVDWFNEEWKSSRGRVMAITDHLTSDPVLVHSAIKMTAESGRLYLVHIEDERSLNRILEVIEKIPEIDSDVANEKIVQRLLHEPGSYIESCRKSISENDLKCEVESIVQVGRGLRDCKKLIREHQVGLLVMHTKDDEQLAMHGLAYPLTVELRETPMLLI